MKNEAFEMLYKRYYNEAMLYVYSFCHNKELSEDIVADSFMKAFRTIDEEKSLFKYWLLKVCRNAYFDYTRKKKRIVQLDDSFDIKADDDVILDVIQNEEYQALYRAINLLKGNHKEVIQLFYFDGLSIKEIASIMEINEDNVKVTLYRARLKLKEILEEK